MRTVFARLLHVFEIWATRKGILLSAIVALLFTLMMSRAFGPQEGPAAQIPPFDTRLWYTAEEFYRDLALYTPAQRTGAITGHLTLDLLYPLVYGTFFNLAIIGLYHHRLAPPWRQRLLLLPWSAVLADGLENLSLSLLFRLYPTRLPGLVTAAATFTAAKWTLIGLTSLVMLRGAGIRLLSREKKE